MTREIKFRAWDIDGKNMVYGQTAIDAIPLAEANPNTVYIMQYTGLKDRTSKEIYEGDIVKYDTEDSVVTAEVIYKESQEEELWISGFAFKPLSSIELEYEDTVTELTIIGNRYENPELM